MPVKKLGFAPKKTLTVLFLIIGFLGFTPSIATTTQDAWTIFCHECTNKSSNPLLDKRNKEELETNQQEIDPEYHKLLNSIIEFETGLNTYAPEESNIPPRIIGIGSTSIGFQIPGIDRWHIRRLPGFASFESAIQHTINMHKYRAKLHLLGIATTDTQLIAIDHQNQYGIVYVVQPFLNSPRLSKTILKNNGLQIKKQLLKKQAAIAEILIKYNKENSGEAITIDIVNNNWEINPLPFNDFEIRLNDLAQPLFKENGTQAYDFYDQALSIIFPFTSTAQAQMQDEFSELFEPRNLMMQALWGYDDQPADLSTFWQRWNYRSIMQPLPKRFQGRQYPQWALSIVNAVLEFMEIPSLSSEEVFYGYRADQEAITCLYQWRYVSLWIRNTLFLQPNAASSLYMNPGNIPIEMYSSQQDQHPIWCLFP